MARTTDQAQRVLDALRSINLPRSNYSVRTERTWHTDRNAGFRYVQYGDAIARFTTSTSGIRSHEELDNIVATHAADLAELGLTVSVITKNDYADLVMVSVSSARNESGRVSAWDTTESARQNAAFLASLEDAR